MTPFTRYLMAQVPGWAVVAALLVLFWPATGHAPEVGVAVFAAWVLKDFLLFPMLRVGYESGATTGVEQLVGMRGVVSRAVAPRGWVRLHGERWRAALVPGEPPIPEGAEVEVRAVTGLTLLVARPADSAGA